MMVLPALAAVMAAACAVASLRGWVVVQRCRSLYGGHAESGSSMLRTMQPALYQADVSDEQARRTELTVRLVVGSAFGLGVVGLWPVALAMVFVATVAPGIALRLHRTRRRDRLVAALPDGLEQVARSLRSGATVVQGLAEASVAVRGPLAEAFDRMVVGTERGESLEGALDRFSAANRSTEVRITAAALAMAATSSSGPSRALDGVSESLRDSHRLEREISALTSQARLSALVLIALPFVFVAINAALDPTSLVFLVHDGTGRMCLVLGVVLDGAGWLWMRRLVRLVQP